VCVVCYCRATRLLEMIDCVCGLLLQGYTSAGQVIGCVCVCGLLLQGYTSAGDD